MVAIYHAYYNFCRVHQTLRVTPAMEVGPYRSRLEFGRIGGIIGQTEGDGGGMIQQKNIRRFSGVCFAAAYATLVTGIVHGLWRGLHIALVLLIFVALWIGFYFTGLIPVGRPAEPKRKFSRGYPDRRGMGAESDFISEKFVPSEHYKAQQRAMAQLVAPISSSENPKDT
jgi:hypothetical protein